MTRLIKSVILLMRSFRGLKRGRNVHSVENRPVEKKQGRINPRKRIKLPALNWKRLKKPIQALPKLFFWLIGVFVLTALVFYGVRWYKSQQQISWAKQIRIPEIQTIIAENFFAPPPKAFEIAKEIEKIIPDDSTVSNCFFC